MKKLHYERMDGKSKATQEGSFIETNLSVGKSTRFLTSLRKTNPSLLGELKTVLESKEGILPQGALFLKSIEGQEGKGMEMGVSISTPPVLVLEGRLASKSLDLTSELILSLRRTPCTNSNQLKGLA